MCPLPHIDLPPNPFRIRHSNPLSLGLYLFFNPFSGINYGFYPRSYFLIFPSRYIMWPIPRRQRAFNMRHDGQMSAVIRGNTGYSMGRAVWITGVGGIAIGHANVVVFFVFWEVEFSFTMSYPNP